VVRVLALKRTRRRAGLFVAVGAVVLLLSALAVGLSGYLDAASTAGARAGLAALTGADGGFRITIPLASDASDQDRRVRATVREVVRTDGAAVPVKVSRDVETIDPVELDAARGAPVRSALASIPDLPARAQLVAGAWPVSADQVSMQADAATAFGVRPGEVLTLPGGEAVTITATWRVRDAADPSWLGDPVALHGLSDLDTAGWVVIDPSLWPQAKAHPVARWTVLPNVARDTASQLQVLESAPDGVSGVLSDDPRNGDAVDQDGLLQVAIRPLAQDVQSAIAASTAPLVVVAVLGLIMIIELARLLEQLRSEENSLLAARGASRARFAAVTGAEAAAVAVPGAALGALIAVGLLALRGASGDIPPLGWVAAAASAAAAVIALSMAAGRSAQNVGGRTGGAAALLRAGRLRTTVGAGAVVLLVLAAVVAVSQFLLYGSPLAPNAGGGLSVDPLAVSAPALAIAAVGVLAITAFPFASRALGGRARRLATLRWLPVVQLARRTRSATAPVLVLAFAVSGLVVAAGYSGTWQTATAETRAVQIGTPLRITPTGVLGASITDRLPGQSDAAPALTTDAQFGDSLVTLVEAPASRLTGILVPVPGAVNPAALAAKLASRAHSASVPRAATGILLRFTAQPVTALPVTVHIVLVDAAGAESEITATPGADGYTATLPDGLAPWTVHALDVLMPEVKAGATLAVTLQATGGSTTTIPLDSTWKPSDPNDALTAGGLSGGRAGLRALVDGLGTHVLIQSVPTGPAGLPVVISGALAQESGLKVGSSGAMSLIEGGGQLSVRVVGVSPAIPGTASGEGILVDLGALQDAALQADLRPISADQWWVSTATPQSATAVLSRRAPPGTRVQTPGQTPADQVLESTRVVVWIAGAATALLALLAIAAGLFIELRARRTEVELLRVLGLTGQEQSRNRTIEWAGLLALGTIAGLIDGFLVAVLLVPGLARTAVPQAIAAIPTTFRLDPVGGPVALVALLLTLGGLLLLVRLTVGRQARSTAETTDFGEGAR
jgi:hypothetical protein